MAVCNTPLSLKKNLELFNDEEKEIFQLLLSLGQAHLFEGWAGPEQCAEEKKAFAQKMIAQNKQYPGGLDTYVKNTLRLLKDSADGKNPYDGWSPSVPSGQRLELGDDNFMKYEELAMSDLSGLGFVIVAGGLGERLGYSGIKPALPSELVTKTSFLQLYIENILALQERARKQKGDDSIILPFALMVSGDTASRSKELMKANRNFGMTDDQIFWLKQEKVVAVEDNDVRFARDGLYDVQTKPHGHGDIHALMHSTGTAKQWKEKFGVKWTLFLQDTNVVVFRSYLSSLGVSKKYNFAMNTITIPRLPGQAVGGIALLTHEDGRKLTINVEYNQLGPLLSSTGDKKGDVADESGYSPYPGNTNSFIVDHDLYVKILEETKGAVPEFVNPKYADASRTKFKKPTRVECMMQEYPKLIISTGRAVGMTQLPPWLAMCPTKNNIKDGKKKYESVGAADSASTGEANWYYCSRQYLRAAGVKIEEGENQIYEGIPTRSGARVVLKPSFGLSLQDIMDKIQGSVEISTNSSLVLGGNVTLKNLKLDGFLSLETVGNAKVLVENLTIKNKGHQVELVDVENKEIDEIYRIRGYDVQEIEMDKREFEADAILNDTTDTSRL